MATMISDLPRDLAEEVLSRLPVTSLRGARSTCKKLNTLTKNRSFTKKHLGEANNKQRTEFQVVMVLEHKVYLFSVNLLCDPSIERIGKLVSLGDEADRVDISKIFHCDGLLLCVTKDRSRLVVWNPYTAQTRWIEPRNSYHIFDSYALGYERKNSYSLLSYKVLRFVEKKVAVVLDIDRGKSCPTRTSLAKTDTSKKLISEDLQTQILGHLCALMFQAQCKSSKLHHQQLDEHKPN